GGVASLAPSLGYDRDRLHLRVAGVYSDVPGGRWNAEAGAAAVFRFVRRGIFDAEVAGQADWTSHYQTRGTTTVAGEVRGYFYPGSATVLWLGQGFGRAISLDRRRPLRRSELGASTRVGPIRVALSLANTSFDLLGAGVTDPRTGQDTLVTVPATSRRSTKTDFTDAVVSGRWSISSTELEVGLGRRFSRSSPELTLWNITAARPLTPHLALVGTAGRAGSDPVTALPGSHYVVAGLRVRFGSDGGSPKVSAPRSAAPELRIGRAKAGGREVVLRAPAGGSVELAGDFTDWQPVPMVPAGDRKWRAVLPIAPGLHRLAVRYDGGDWQAPPGARRVASEFGGDVGEIIVE
ncbi:MAG: glycogen-binding domain-containing protein, partial [Gemmatimonadales bacterium]